MTTTKENVSEATEAKQTKPNRIKIDNKSPKAESKSLVKFDPLQRYLSEISQYRLLTREEEVELGKRVQEEEDMEAAYQLVTSNLSLVVKIALEFQRVWMQNLLDLIQEGNIGLMQAVKKFDPYKNVKFSYYASFWIKAYILKFIMDNWRLVKIGTTQGQRKLFFKLKKEKQHLIEQGSTPNRSCSPSDWGFPSAKSSIWTSAWMVGMSHSIRRSKRVRIPAGSNSSVKARPRPKIGLPKKRSKRCCTTR
jgi:RNA polymerase sigma-32 factor